MSSNITPWVCIENEEAEQTAANADVTTAQDITNTQTIGANTLQDGSVIHAVCVGHVTTAGTYTLAWSVEINGTAVLTTTATSTGATITAEAVRIDVYGVVRSTGSSGTILWSMSVNADTAAIQIDKCDTSADTLDMTADATINLAITYGTAGSLGTNTFIAQQFYTELIGS